MKASTNTIICKNCGESYTEAENADLSEAHDFLDKRFTVNEALYVRGPGATAWFDLYGLLRIDITKDFWNESMLPGQYCLPDTHSDMQCEVSFLASIIEAIEDNNIVPKPYCEHGMNFDEPEVYVWKSKYFYEEHGEIKSLLYCSIEAKSPTNKIMED